MNFFKIKYLLLFLFLAACSKNQFSVNELSLSDFEPQLKNTKILSKGIDLPNRSAPSIQTPSQEIKIPASTVCFYHDVGPFKVGGGVQGASSLELVVTDSSNATVCEIKYNNEKIKNDILNQKAVDRVLDLSSCSLTNGTYNVDLTGNLPGQNGNSLITTAIGGDKAIQFKIVNGVVSVINTARIVALIQPGSHRPTGEGETDPCGENADPLMIQMKKEVHLSFADLSKEFLFDILGYNALDDNQKPKAFTPKQIGWIEQPEFMFIAKLNSKGKVEGIQDLFGNNTRGPDGAFALNGFEALKKYDGKSADGKTTLKSPNGTITAEDPVFNELRLWSDVNLDGVAQDSELHTLPEMKVYLIFLSYDEKYEESDGLNSIKYKSVALLENNETALVFDIWFGMNK